MNAAQFTGLIVGLLLGYLIIAGLLVFRRLPPLARRLFAGLTLAEIGIAVLHTRTWDRGFDPFLSWLFDLNLEQGLGATLSSVQLMTVAVVATAIALMIPFSQRWQRVYWLLIVAAFAFFSLDEYFLIHENYYLAGGVWQIPWAIGGAALFAVSVVAWWRGFRTEKRLFLLLFGGLFLMGFASIIIDYVVQEVICVAQGVGCHRYIIIEEFLEMAGVSIALVGLVAYAEDHLRPVALRRAGRIVAAGGMLWLVWLVSYLWLIPTAEAALSTTAANVNYLDGALELAGYRLSDTVIEPGEQLDVTLYFRANDFLQAEYSVSVNLFTHPDIDSVANADMLLGEWKYPSFGWLPGFMVRNRLQVPIPADLATNRSYWLVARIWQDDWQNGLSISQSEVRQFDETTVILTSLAAPDQNDLPVPPLTADYQFADGFSLAGVDLPEQVESAGTLRIVFWWHTRQPLGRDLTQFVHVRSVDGEGFFAFDQPPFGGVFPTQDWPANVEMIDHWQVSLPPDLPPGDYTVQTGLYTPETIERVPVLTASGEPVLDNAITLGTITVTDKE